MAAIDGKVLDDGMASETRGVVLPVLGMSTTFKCWLFAAEKRLQGRRCRNGATGNPGLVLADRKARGRSRLPFKPR